MLDSAQRCAEGVDVGHQCEQSDCHAAAIQTVCEQSVAGMPNAQSEPRMSRQIQKYVLCLRSPANALLIQATEVLLIEQIQIRWDRGPGL